MKSVIAKAYSKKELVDIFKGVGVKSGMVLEVHAALSAFSFIIGGAETFIDALLEVLDYNGTLVMAMQCGLNEDPSGFKNPPMAFELHEKYRQNYPAFNPITSESYHMGSALNNLRRRKDVVFSNHPNVAFCAIGRYAKMITNYQNLDFGLDDLSPLGRLYELKAHCLLCGVDYDNMTSLHLSEYRSGIRPIKINGAVISDGGFTSYKKYLDIELDSNEFLAIGKLLEERGLVNVRKIEDSKIKLLRIDTAVNTGVKYFREKMQMYKE